MIDLPDAFPAGFDPDADLLAGLQRLLQPLGTITAAAFPEWYASYVYVAISRPEGARWVLCNKYRPVVGVAQVEPADGAYLAVPTLDGFVTDAAIRAALAPGFLVLTAAELARSTAEIDPTRVSDYERPYLERARVVAELLFNNSD